MKKVLFLMLLFVVLGVVNINSQVRIGGDGEPNAAAVLDLNVDDDTDTGTKGLALPRVSLVSHDDLLGYSDLLEGMLVYNTNISMTGGVGVYYWDGNEWVKLAGGSDYIGSTSIELSGNSFQRAALSGDVTAAQNSNTVTINDNTVSLAKTTVRVIEVSAATLELTAGSTLAIPLPTGCVYPNVWATYYCEQWCSGGLNPSYLGLRRVATTTTSKGDMAIFFCW